MRRRLFVVTTAVLALWVTSTIAQSGRNELDLYRAGRWFELRAIVTPRSPALIRGAVAAAFNDPTHAEQLLRNVIGAQPTSDDADDAYALLCRIYIMSGRYSRFVSTYREWGATFPGSPKYREQQNGVERFGDDPIRSTVPLDGWSCSMNATRSQCPSQLTAKQKTSFWILAHCTRS